MRFFGFQQVATEYVRKALPRLVRSWMNHSHRHGSPIRKNTATRSFTKNAKDCRAVVSQLRYALVVEGFKDVSHHYGWTGVTRYNIEKPSRESLFM